jgi:periplasmic protein TonB
MFEDSLVESTGRIRTRSNVYAAGSFVFETVAVAVLFLIPYFYPASLPKEALLTPLVAPLPPSAPAQMPHAPMAQQVTPVQLIGLVPPRMIPRHIPVEDSAPSTPGIDTGPRDASTGQVPGAIFLSGSTPPPPVVVPPKPSTPLRVSAGVADGHILVPIRPVYPPIAKAAGVQGTVVIEATITKQGAVDRVHVLSGPPMLTQAALAAVSRAKYEPFTLNGDPVEVETTINIIFALSN